MDTQVIKKFRPQNLIGKRDSPPERSLQKILQDGSGRSGAPPKGDDVTGELPAET
jgi:hypothetical protein